MAGGADPAVRTFAFGGAEPGGWGAAWLVPGAPATGVLGLPDRAGAEELTLEGAGPEEPWQLRTGAGELMLEGVTAAVWRDPQAPEDGFDQLCRVRGTIEAGGGRSELDCLGWRGTRPPGIDPAVSSFRLTAGWFDPDEGFSLLALRPRKASGQDEDVIDAALFDPGAARPVAEPRLSTTYTGSGEPTRAGVELWMETEPDSDHLYPRRAVGQALAPPVHWQVADVALEAQPLRWFSGGREGTGIYLLGQW